MILDYLETHLVDHCNLQCTGCGHFSPLAGENVVTVASLERDFARLAQLFDNIAVIRLMGGEPLLHPDVATAAERVRSYFPRARLSIVTNGLLLPQQPERFWKTCHTSDVLIQITNYPIKIDLEKSQELARRFGVTVEVGNAVTEFVRFLNPKGDSDPAKAFHHCRTEFRCPFLRDGRIFLCPLPATVHAFNERFATAIAMGPTDSINIFEDVSAADILTFLNHCSPFCRWCLEAWPTFRWRVGRKRMEDWVGG